MITETFVDDIAVADLKTNDMNSAVQNKRSQNQLCVNFGQFLGKSGQDIFHSPFFFCLVCSTQQEIGCFKRFRTTWNTHRRGSCIDRTYRRQHVWRPLANSECTRLLTAIFTLQLNPTSHGVCAWVLEGLDLWCMCEDALKLTFAACVCVEKLR